MRVTNDIYIYTMSYTELLSTRHSQRECNDWFNCDGPQWQWGHLMTFFEEKRSKISREGWLARVMRCSIIIDE
jgi:hypothetical protein